MNHTTYKNEKTSIKSYAINNAYLDDKPLKRMLLNDYLDSLIKSNVFLKYSEKRQQMYFNWLSNYVCKLHKKYC